MLGYVQLHCSNFRLPFVTPFLVNLKLLRYELLVLSFHCPLFNLLQVALSNAKCLADGYGSCLYNYESTTLNKFSITVRSTDSGSPPLSVDCRLTVDITDVNDQPRKLLLSGYTLKEGASIGTQVGRC